MLLYSLGAIDTNRISQPIVYIEGYSDYLIAALLPEDVDVLSTEYDRITEI